MDLTYVASCQASGLVENIDDWIDTWHDADGAPHGYPQAIWDYLGLTDFEYALWVTTPTSLPLILSARTYDIS